MFFFIISCIKIYFIAVNAFDYCLSFFHFSNLSYILFKFFLRNHIKFEILKKRKQYNDKILKNAINNK